MPRVSSRRRAAIWERRTASWLRRRTWLKSAAPRNSWRLRRRPHERLRLAASPNLHPIDTAARPMSGRRPVRLHAVTMLELEDRYLCEQLRLNMGAAVRLLEDAGAALDRRDAPLARAVLGTESFGDPGMR